MRDADVEDGHNSNDMKLARYEHSIIIQYLISSINQEVVAILSSRNPKPSRENGWLPQDNTDICFY